MGPTGGNDLGSTFARLLLARALPCAVARTHALQQTTCADYTPPPHRKPERPRFRRTKRYGKSSRSSAETSSLRLDVGGPDHLAPFLGFLRDQLAKLSRRSGQRHAAEVSETGLILGSARAALTSLKRQRYFSFISLKMFIFFVLGPVQTGRAPAGRGGSARVEARPPSIWDQDPRMGPALAAIATRKWEVSRSKCSSLNSPPTAADKAIGRSSTIGKSTIGEDAR